jgi:iron complex outermembrane receptor protein
LFVPLVGASNAMPGIERLNLSLAARYEEYSDFGNTLNPKVGLVWTPFSAVDVRGAWGKSFRAPGLAEVDPRSSGSGLYGDTLPCNNPGPTCIGIGIAGGNANLQPENAETWSIGFDLHPETLKGFRASVTYFDINYENQILGLRGTAGLLTNPLYAQYAILNPTPAQVAALLASGQAINTPINPATVTYIQDGRRQNLGATLASGIDFDISQSFDSGIGRFDFGVQGSYFTKLETSIVAGAPFVDVADTINNPQSLRARASAGWSNGPFNARAFVNYVSSYDQAQAAPLTTLNIDAYTTVDLHLGYDIPVETGLAKGISIGLDASNLFDQDPPFVNLNGGYDPQSASPIGRLVAISVRKDW